MTTRTYNKEDYQCLSDFYSCVGKAAQKEGYPVKSCPIPKCVVEYNSDAEANQP